MTQLEEIVNNLKARIDDLEKAVIELKIESVYGLSNIDVHICPSCGDERNWKAKENDDGEYFVCSGCGAKYDENGNEC
jgi:predicted RNA-binding Zn-ribbon protein involved in translation (DUF1610 family)